MSFKSDRGVTAPLGDGSGIGYYEPNSYFTRSIARSSK